MKIWNKIFFAYIILILTSCAGTRKVNFTQEIRNKLEAKNIDITKLQYYIYGDVFLTREISSDTAKITKGEVVFQNGKYYENITLKHNTLGVCTAVYPNRLSVSFDEDNNKFLTFSTPNTTVYQLVNNEILYTNPNIVTYNGIQYLLNFKGNSPSLLIKKSVVNKQAADNRTMKGRKVN